ncbi:MAG TPA: N-acetylmuramoyl-L-alanine amidase [Chloroflexota bacterium]|nr:N-acetylmuramoyl-L-alanine amidase [Chloroflexota bacterium]
MPTEMAATWLGSPNFTNLGARTVLGVVLHSSEGTLAGMTAVFSQPGGASAHYAIGTDGRRYQYVRDKDVAYHVAAFGNNAALNRNRPNWLPAYNGRYSAVNACTIGIELEGYAAQGFTPAQYTGLSLLLIELSERHSFPPTLQPDAGAAARIVTHAFLQTDRSDPGAWFEWNTLRDALTPGDDDMALTPDQQTILDAAATQTAAGNTIANGGDLDWWIGTWHQLASDKESLAQLLTKSQGETQAQAVEVARLQSLLAAPGAPGEEVAAVEVRLSGGKSVVLTR